MEFHLSEERAAQLNEYAQRYGQDPLAALDELLADALEWNFQDREETLEAPREGLEDVKAGRTQPAAEVFLELRERYGLPR